MSSRSESTVVWFPKPLSPPRVPATGEAQLVFSSASDRAAQEQACRIKVSDNCLKGARHSCSVRAIRKCKQPHPVLVFLGLARGRSWEEVAACEDDFMQGCLVEGRAQCQQHAERFCAQAFSGPVLK